MPTMNTVNQAWLSRRIALQDLAALTGFTIGDWQAALLFYCTTGDIPYSITAHPTNEQGDWTVTFAQAIMLPAHNPALGSPFAILTILATNFLEE